MNTKLQERGEQIKKKETLNELLVKYFFFVGILELKPQLCLNQHRNAPLVTEFLTMLTLSIQGEITSKLVVNVGNAVCRIMTKQERGT